MKVEEVVKIMGEEELREVYPRIRHKVDPEVRKILDDYLEVDHGDESMQEVRKRAATG